MVNRLSKDEEVNNVVNFEFSEDWEEGDLIDLKEHNINVEQLEKMIKSSVDTVSKEILYCKILSKLDSFIAYVIVCKDKTTTTVVSKYDIEVAFIQEYLKRYNIKIYK